jgi:hypothetical protein
MHSSKFKVNFDSNTCICPAGKETCLDSMKQKIDSPEGRRMYSRGMWMIERWKNSEVECWA